MGGEKQLGGDGGDHRVSWQKWEADVLYVGARREHICDQRSSHGCGDMVVRGSEGDGGDCGGEQRGYEWSQRFLDSGQIEGCQIWEERFVGCLELRDGIHL